MPTATIVKEKKKEKKEVRIMKDVQQLYDLDKNFSDYSVVVFGKTWNIENIAHVKRNIYSCSLIRGEEELTVALSSEHAVVLGSINGKKVDSEDALSGFDDDLDLDNIGK